jgi:enoyl-CoA hydratase/carnithine racemase
VDYEQVTYEQDGPVAIITWNRPDRLNSITPQLEVEHRDACLRADRDPSVKAVILRGAGRCFSTGYDLSAVGSTPRSWPGGVPEGEDVGEYLMRYRDTLKRSWDNQYLFAQMDKPVIAQVHSWCMGGGTWYALSCDVVCCSDDAVFGQPEVRNMNGISFVWATRVGWSNALRYALTGDHIDAQEALRIGAANEVYPRAELEERTMRLAKRMALLPLESLKLNKAMIRKGMDMMGFANAHYGTLEISILAHTVYRREPNERFGKTAAEKGMRAFLRERDEPFLPEPFGPRATMTRFPDRD